MKILKIVLFIALFALFLPENALTAPNDQQNTRSSNISRVIDGNTYLDINSLLCFIANQGNFAYDFDSIFGRFDGLYYPRGTGKTVVYDAGIWVGARVEGDLRLAVATYSTEYVPGPMENGTFMPDSPDFKVYKINRGDTPESNPDYANWPSDMGAPVDDLGKPLLLGDQTCWAVYNDADTSQHGDNAGNTLPLGIEIQQTSFAYGRAGSLGHTIYIKYLIINKGGHVLDSTYISLWADPDVGDPSNDLVGCDTVLSLGYAYNGSATDAVYGSAPPAVGIDFLQGPIVPAGTWDHAFYKGEWIDGYRNLPMTSFNKYVNGTDPSSRRETYNYMKGLTAGGDPLVDPSGDTTTFFVAGDPVANTGWLDASPADRRMMMSSGPFTMMPGDTQEVVAAIIIGQGGDPISSITALKESDEQVQNSYSYYFDIPSPPPAFTVYARGLNGSIDLTWSSLVEDYYQNFIDEFDEFYVFEGYNIYQGESEYGPWHKVATYDMTAAESEHNFLNHAGEYIMDCYDPGCDSTLRPWNFALIYNWIIDPETGYPVLTTVQEGDETGVQNHMLINEDMVNGGPIINDMPYYFAVTGYTVNIQDVRSEDSVFLGNSFLGFNAMTLESPIEPIMITPRANPGLYEDTAQHVAGNSDGIVLVDYLDPNALVPGNYEVGFNTDKSWFLERDGLTLLNNQTNQSGDYDYPIVDGIMTRVIGPAAGIAPPANSIDGGVIQIQDASGPIFPDNVFWSYDASSSWYVSSDVPGSSDAARARFNWRLLMGLESWEFRFTETGSNYFNWNTGEVFEDTAPFEVWHYSGNEPDPDRRDVFEIIDDDESGGWSMGDRIYIIESAYPEPFPQNDGSIYYMDGLHLGRVIFNDGGGGIPETGVIVRFNTTIPNSAEDVFTFTVTGAGYCGDVNNDSEVNISDPVYLINYIFMDGPEPDSFDSSNVNCDSQINITDVVYLINYIFRGGNAPCDSNGDGEPDCG